MSRHETDFSRKFGATLTDPAELSARSSPITAKMIVMTVPDVRAVVEPKGYLITPTIWRKRLSIGWIDPGVRRRSQQQDPLRQRMV